MVAAAVEAGAAQSSLKIMGSLSDLKHRCRPLCQVSSASMVVLSAMLVLGLLTPLAIAFPPIDQNITDQGFHTEDIGVFREGSRRLQFHLDTQGRETGRVLGASAGGYLRKSQPNSTGFDEKAFGISHDGKGGTLRDGRDRCFVDEDGYQRCYPTVFFFGTSKCATTSLARWLDAHPATHWVANPRRPHQIEETGVKEAHVFDDPPKGDHLEEQVFLHEKLLITSPKVTPENVVIDYTPHYLASSEAPHRIASMYGKGSGLKFIVTLREPASRAISSWEFKNEFNPKRGRQEERRTLEKTVRDGIKRGTKLLACIEQAKKKNLSNRQRDLIQCNPRKILEMPLYVSHVGKSMYAVQLERWFNLFGRENVKVVFMDDMAVDPMGVLQDVLDFLGLNFSQEDESEGIPTLDHWKKVTGMAYNKTKSKKKDELANQVTDELKAELQRFFEPQNRQLETLLGYPVPPAWNL